MAYSVLKCFRYRDSLTTSTNSDSRTRHLGTYLLVKIACAPRYNSHENHSESPGALTPNLWTLTLGVVVSICLTTFVVAQTNSGPTEGILPFETAAGGQYDIVNLANLSINIHATIQSKAGMSNLPLSYAFGANEAQTPSLNNFPGPWYQSPGGFLGLHASSPSHSGLCPDGVTRTTVAQKWSVVDSTGNRHTLPNLAVDSSGCADGLVDIDSANDGSGITVKADWTSGSLVTTVWDRSGNNVTNPANSFYARTAHDPSGNTISSVWNGVSAVFTDSLGQAALTVTPGINTTYRYQWLNASGQQSQATVNITSPLYWGTNFCGVQFTGGPFTTASGVTFADGSSLTIGFEQAVGITNPQGGPYYTGRFSSLTIPSGATITYAYSGGTAGINCSDGTPNTLKRTTPDGTWTYVHTPPGPTTLGTTNVLDPLGNEIDYTFSGQYETLRKIYSGSAATGILLKTVRTVYNNSSGTVTLPITRIDSYVTLAGQTTATLTTRLLNATGLVTQIKEYSNSILLLRTTFIGYGTWNSATGACDNISNTRVADRVCYHQVIDETGTPTTVAQSVRTYDGNGNLTSLGVWNGNAYLTTSYALNPNGTPNTSSSPLGLVSTFGYSCNNGLASSISYNFAVGSTNLSTGQTIDCIGAVPTATSDMNGQGSTMNYGADPFYRPLSVTDALGNVTSVGYGGGATYTSIIYPTSNGATNSAVTYADTLGRPYNTQTKDGTAYDTTTIYRNWTGAHFNIQQTMPCSVTTVGVTGTCPATKSITTSYDPLGRTVSVVDASGKQVSYQYFPATVSGINVVDVLISIPGKSNQREYDALGRLISVCEISIQPGSGACGQAHAQNGFITKYTYNMLGKITKVIQGAQTRTFSYDALGRLLSESNPESGTTNYTWDSATTKCMTPFPGKLVQKSDANGNTVCLNYDFFGRLTSTVFSGPNAGANSYFVYDAATYGATAMNYAKGRLAEAYTCTSCPGTKITDEFFSYDQRGKLTDMWEKTPHSPTAYYHTTASFYPNETVASLTVPGATTNLSWALDAKGRLYSATANNGSANLVGSTIYDPADRTVTINLGLGDQDNYLYDSNERMTNFTFRAGSSGKTVAGALTWNNNNGTLATLQISDGWNGTATETCNYSYDDMLRLKGDQCGLVWSQTFAYDRYGNITKAGSQAFNPGYNASTNQYSSLLNATYDNNGNLTNDGTNGYAFDANNFVSSVVTALGTSNIIRDALGRMVEIARPGGTYTQILYSAIGKTANMSGSNVQRIFAPLPGGGQLTVEVTPGNYLFHHKDWLGTSRFISARGSRSMYFDTAFAPFGETYSSSGTTDLDFTNQRQDIVAGIYDFQYREYNPVHGRWLSPDPAGLHAVDPTNPQTWNRYAYVANDPLRAVDPFGLEEDSGANPDEEEVQNIITDSIDGAPSIGDIMSSPEAQASAEAQIEAVINSGFDIAQGPNGTTFNALQGQIPQLREGDISVIVHGGGPLMENGDMALEPNRDPLRNSEYCPTCGDVINGARIVSDAAFVGTGLVLASPPAAAAGAKTVAIALLGAEVAHLIAGTEEDATVPSVHIPGQEPEGREPDIESAPFAGPPPK
jgi:RHS repeat-associated protein